jgi:two-component system cell cycle response regulator CtrA
MRVLIWPTDPSTGIALAEALRKHDGAIGIYMGGTPLAAIHFLRSARETGVMNCIMVLLATAGEPRTLIRQRVSVLAAGADDAQHWPLDLRELVARLKAIAGRTREQTDAPVALPGGFYYRETGTIVGEVCSIHLTKQEQGIFEALVDRPGSVVTKGQIMTALYHEMDEPQQKVVDVFVCKLRKKLAPVCRDVEVIQTVWGQGYRFMQHGFRPERVTALKRMAVR